MYAVTSTFFFFFFFNDTATTEIYTLSLHDALPICRRLVDRGAHDLRPVDAEQVCRPDAVDVDEIGRATSELQSQSNLVCRLLLEKKKKTAITPSWPHAIYASPNSIHPPPPRHHDDT